MMSTDAERPSLKAQLGSALFLWEKTVAFWTLCQPLEAPILDDPQEFNGTVEPTRR